MAAAPDNGMLRLPGPAPLGAILVQHGVLTAEQLTAALAEQKRTGEQLGEIIVRLGFAAAPMIGQALATQHGGLLKTEYGYAVGFGGTAPAGFVGRPPVSPVPVEGERSAALAPVSAPRVAPPESAPAPAPAPAHVPAALAAPGQPAPDPVALQWQQHAQQLAAQRDAALHDLQALAGERAAFAALETARAHVVQLEQQLEEATAQITQLEAERKNVLAIASALGEEQHEYHPDEHSEDPSHLLFAPVHAGYLLFEQEVPPPAPGSTLEIAENNGTSSRLIVAKVGAAPLPGVRLACAYLIEAD